jgi:hypothetical protein
LHPASTNTNTPSPPVSAAAFLFTCAKSSPHLLLFVLLHIVHELLLLRRQRLHRSHFDVVQIIFRVICAAGLSAIALGATALVLRFAPAPLCTPTNTSPHHTNEMVCFFDQSKAASAAVPRSAFF